MGDNWVKLAAIENEIMELRQRMVTNLHQLNEVLDELLISNQMPVSANRRPGRKD